MKQASRAIRSTASGQFVVLSTPSPTRMRTAEERQALARGLKRNQALRSALERRG
jgi:hypothetical protein